MDLKSKPVNLQENVSLSRHTTFRIGGAARYFVAVKNESEILEAVKFAKENNLDFFVFAGGSNILANDKGYGGLAIKIQNNGLRINENKIFAEAGAPLSKIVMESINNNLTGLEWAVGIPGTIGGAVFGNTGAYGHSISESVRKVGILTFSDLTFKSFSLKDCGFVYRGSNFKKNQTEFIISIELELSVGDKTKSLEAIKNILAQRRTKIPPFPSAGSFFTNYRLQKDFKNDPLVLKHPDLAKIIRSGKIGVGYLIEQCDLKGARIGGAMVANEHTNFIVNTGGATAADVLTLAELCREKVKAKYGLDLEIEKRLIGF